MVYLGRQRKVKVRARANEYSFASVLGKPAFTVLPRIYSRLTGLIPAAIRRTILELGANEREAIAEKGGGSL